MELASLVMVMERILQHFRLKLGCEMEGMRSLFIEKVARKVWNDPCAWHVKLHCMGLHDHAQGPKTMPNEL